MKRFLAHYLFASVACLGVAQAGHADNMLLKCNYTLSPTVFNEQTGSGTLHVVQYSDAIGSIGVVEARPGGRNELFTVLDAQILNNERDLKEYHLILGGAGKRTKNMVISVRAGSVGVNYGTYATDDVSVMQCEDRADTQVNIPAIDSVVAEVARRPELFSCTYADTRGAGATLIAKQGPTPTEIVLMRNGWLYELRPVAQASRREMGNTLRYGFTFVDPKDGKIRGSLVASLNNRTSADYSKRELSIKLDSPANADLMKCSWTETEKFGTWETALDEVVNAAYRRP